MQRFAPSLGRCNRLTNPSKALTILLVSQNAELRSDALVEASLFQCRPRSESDRQMLYLSCDTVGESGCLHPFSDLARCRIPTSVYLKNVVEVLVDVPLIKAGMWIQTDDHHQPTRAQHAHGFCEKCDLALKMMKG